MRIGVIGEALVDLLPADGDTMLARPGGSPANVAVALARLGMDTHFLGRTSTDRWGTRLRAHLEAEGVVLDGSVGDEPTALAVVDLDGDGQPRYRFLWEATADRMVRTGDLVVEGLDAVHVGSVACLLEPGAGAIARVVGAIDEQRVVSFDPNVRLPLVDDPATARTRLRDLAEAAHLVRASDEDLQFLFPGQDTGRAARQLLDGAQTQVVVVTRGADDAELHTPRFQLPIPVVTTDHVVDTVGAGDTFMAGLLVGLAEHDALRVPALKTLDARTAGAVGRFAAAAAGAVVTRAGADPPRRSDL